MRIRQIIPAERGWHVIKYPTDPSNNTVESEIACWALLADDSVVPMIVAGEDLLGLVVADLIGDTYIFSPAESWNYLYFDAKDHRWVDVEKPDCEVEYCGGGDRPMFRTAKPK